MTAELDQPADQPGEETRVPEPEPEPVYDTDEAALVAERLEALGYID